MNLAHFGFLILFLIVLTSLLIQMSILKKKINHLPKPKMLSFNFNALVGKDITKLLKLPKDHNKSSLLLVVSPTCSVCHDLLDNAVKREQNDFLCYVDTSNTEKYKEIEEEYSGHIDLIPLSYSEPINQFVQFYPFFIWIDQNGLVTKTSFNSQLK